MEITGNWLSTTSMSYFTVADLVFIVQADKIQTLLTAAKVQEVEPIWASIFAKVNIRTLPLRQYQHSLFNGSVYSRNATQSCETIIELQ